MRIGLIADIHGNTVALDSVLADLRRSRIDLIVCLGDLAASGPDPVGAVERIMEAAIPTVIGNTDADVVNIPEWWHDPRGAGAPDTAQRTIEVSLWCASQLGAGHREFLSGLAVTAEFDLGGDVRLLAFHGSVRSVTDIITADTAPDELEEMLAGAHQQLLAGGHTHVPLVRPHGDQTLLNPGSVGSPFASYGYAGEVAVLNHAAYGIVTASSSGISIELRNAPIDLDRLARQVKTSGMPHPEWWLSLRR